MGGVMTEGDDIRAAEERLRLAMLSGDADALGALIDDRLVFTGPTGAVLTKADDLGAHRSGLLRLTRLEMLESQIHPEPGLAVVTAKAALEGSFGGTPFSGLFAYTRVWTKSSGGWQVRAGHCAMIGGL